MLAFFVSMCLNFLNSFEFNHKCTLHVFLEGSSPSSFTGDPLLELLESPL